MTVEHFAEQLQKYWNGGAFTQFKLILRLFACLGDMMGDEGVYPLIGQLFGRLEEWNKPGNEGLVIAVTYILLITLPYAMVSGSEKFSEETLKEILARAEQYKDVQHPLQSYIDPFGGNQNPYNEPNAQGVHMANILFQNLQMSLSGEPQNDWSGIKCLPTPWKDMITKGPAQTLPTLEMASEVPADSAGMYPEFYFSVFADQPFKVRNLHKLSQIYTDSSIDSSYGDGSRERPFPRCNC